MKPPPLHLTLFGATSFVGQILTRYLFEQYGRSGALRLAIAGRSEPKLVALRDSLGQRAAKLPILVADADDSDALRAMCTGTRVVVSTVGPYALHGEPLVRICAETGTDYCDLTGEVQWIRRMIERYEARARESGARIVHCCGFDSIPSDMGVFFLQQLAMQRFAQPCTRVKMRVKAMRGGMSGGTSASLLNVVKEAAADPALRRELADPYSLCPPSDTRPARQPAVSLARYDDDFHTWIAPFVMAAINTRIVHRSNALSEHVYGSAFRYDEAMLTGRRRRRNRRDRTRGGYRRIHRGGCAAPFTLGTRALRASGARRWAEPAGAAQRLLRPEILRPHRERANPQGQGDRRPRPRLRFDRQDAGRGGGLPGAGRVQGGQTRWLLDAGHRVR